MKTRMISAVLALGFTAAPAAAVADACPPNVSDFDTWTWIPSWNSGDDWVNALVCASNAKRDAVKSLVINNLGLDQNWDYWEDMLTNAKICNPNFWGGRTIDGGYATQLVGEHRDNDSFAHFASPGGILPDGTPVKFWLTQYAAYYISEEGYDWECLADGDAAGPDDGLTFASNPASNSACSFYYPWFWNKTVMDRASTIVHEATHEFQGHLSDSACTNGGSCDDVFMNANAQSFQIIFDAQAVDAYQREPNSRDLKVVNFGNSVCGYLPLLPDLDRFALVQVMISKLKNVFQTVPPTSQYPASAVIDSVPGTIYDLAGNPGGKANTAYRIDISNQARWPCDKVCDRNDYAFNANGASGKRACNEQYQPGNAAVNAANRLRCDDLNAQVAAGVTPAEHASLRNQVYYMQSCVPGVSDAYLGQVCDALIPAADHVADIDAAWPLPDDLGYGYSAEEAIRTCQTTFCGRQNIDGWNADAAQICYEWDDNAGCMDLLCGDLSALEANPGRDSIAYLDAVVCRASELGRRVGLHEADVGCDKVFNDCTLREKYLPLWEAQLAGDDCWSDSLPVRTPDPLFRDLRRSVGQLSADRYVVAARASGLLTSQCLLEEAQCEALQAAMRAIAARIAKIKTRERPPWVNPVGPDPWERLDRLENTFDRDFTQSMVHLGEDLEAGDVGPLWRDARLRRAGAMPEAQVALAELLGQDTYFRIGGARYHAGVFSPERLQRFGGANRQADPYGLSIAGFEAELTALETFTQRTSTRQWAGLIALSPGLDGVTYYNHTNALLEARNGMDLLAALDALQADLEALQR